MTSSSDTTKEEKSLNMHNEAIIDIKKMEEKEDHVVDRFYIIRLLYLLLGVVHIIPWTFFLNANEYYMYKFRNTTLEEDLAMSPNYRTYMQYEFSAMHTIALQVSNVLALMATLMYGYKFTLNSRLVNTLIIMLGLFIMTAVFIYQDTDSWQAGFFAFTMLTVAAIAAINSTFGIAIYTTLSNFPREFLGFYLNGQGVAQIFNSLLELFSLFIGVSTLTSALFYFGIGTFVLALGLVCILLARKNKCFVYHMKKFHEGEEEKMMSWGEFTSLTKQIWPTLAVMFLIQFSTNPIASILPLVVSEGQGQGNDWNDVYFVPTIAFLLPAVTQLIGRTVSTALKSEMNPILLAGFSSVLLLFPPLLMLCNALPRDSWPVLFPRDYQYIIILTIFNLIQGYVYGAATMNIPRLVSEKEKNNAFQVYVMVMGVFIAGFSILSFLSVEMI